MSRNISVYKFGGASIKDVDSVRNMFKIVAQTEASHLVVVVSAMGKMTNALERLLQMAYTSDDAAAYASGLQDIKDFHTDIAQQLFVQESGVFKALEQLFLQLKADVIAVKKNFSSFNQAYDAIVSYGELLSSTLLAYFFQDNAMPCVWQDVRQCIITDSTYRKAHVQIAETYANIQATFKVPQIYLTQGFIGSDTSAHTTTLGREGSDYSAALIAAALEAVNLRIWKDVDGVFSADPRLFSNARIVEQLSYKEAVEMAYFGAGVIHPKTMVPLTQKQIPLRVCSFLNPESKGSLVHYQDKPMPLCVIVKKHLYLFSLTSLAYDMIDEQQKQLVFHLLYQQGAVVLSSQQIALSLSVCVDIGTTTLASVLEPLQERYKVRYNSEQMLVSMRHYTQAHLSAIMPMLSSVKMEQKDRHNYHFVIDDNADALPILQQLNDLL